MKQAIKTKETPAVVGPYSQAIIYDKLVFVSGQIAVDPKTNQLIDGDISVQTRLVFENLKKVLQAAGTNLDNVLKVNVYLKNMNDFAVMNEIYATYFQKPYPARATIEVSNLPRGALVEIDCIAFININKNCCGQDCNCS